MKKKSFLQELIVEVDVLVYYEHYYVLIAHHLLEAYFISFYNFTAHS